MQSEGLGEIYCCHTLRIINNQFCASVLEGNVQSILIMEDDVDWDIRILSQMPEFAKGVRSVSNIPFTAPQESPYGDDWDILWPGHCGEAKETTPEEIEPLYIIKDDPTVAPRQNLSFLPHLENYPDNTRIVHRAVQPVCTFAYAVSRRGAQKILAAVSLKAYWNLAFDLQLALACRHQLLGLKCITVEPYLFHHHKAAGSTDRDSDIKIGADKPVQLVPETLEPIRKQGITRGIVWSARMNVEQLIMGSQEYFMQW